MIGMLTSALGIIAKPVTTFIKKRGEIKIAEHTRDLAVINNQARLASDAQTNNANWEMAALQDKDRFLRRFSFFLFTSPMFLAVLAPEYWTTVVANLDAIPGWMLQIQLYMIAGIWGMAELKNSVPAMLSSLTAGKKK